MEKGPLLVLGYIGDYTTRLYGFSLGLFQIHPTTNDLNPHFFQPTFREPNYDWI